MGTTPRDVENDTTVTVFESDGYIVARDEESGVASQGETKSEALVNLADALELHSRPESSDEELEEPDAPWF
jgi:predicted RNase H-like HicB family nuclease